MFSSGYFSRNYWSVGYFSGTGGGEVVTPHGALEIGRVLVSPGIEFDRTVNDSLTIESVSIKSAGLEFARAVNNAK